MLLGCGDQYCTTFLNIKTKQIVKNFHIEWIQIVDEGWQWLGLSRQSGYFGLWFVSSYWLKLFSNHDFTHEFYKDKGKKRPRMANLKEIFPSVYLKKFRCLLFNKIVLKIWFWSFYCRINSKGTSSPHFSCT